MPPSPRRIPFAQWLALRRRDRFIAVSLILLLTAFATTAAVWRTHRASTQLQRLRGVVTTVVDAVTFDLTTDDHTSPRRIRLLGTTCPPTWQPAASAWLDENLLGRSVTVTFDPSDASGGLVYRSDGLFVNEFLIDQGVLRADPSADHALASWFSRLADWAAADRRGQWNVPAPADE